MRTAPPRGLVGASGVLSATRSRVPRLPAGLVRRPRLERLLDDGVAAGTVVVSGPAGSGKTLLLASWAAGRRPPVAWLSVEPSDADPHQFWARVLASLQAVDDVPPASLLATLHPPSAHDPRFVSVLVEACTALPGPRVLVLDDAHLVDGTPAERSLAGVVRRGLGGLRLVVATRTVPGLPLQRLRLEGRLTELRAGDLQFDAAEAAQLLRAHGVVLPPAQLATLLEKTEGWAAGLRLAALSLQSAGDVGAVVEQLAGDQRAVADYFMQEVLDGQDPELTGFLLDTCVVHRISGDLADALTGRSDGRLLLGRLARANLFVVALDDRNEWYRYHQLFGDLLRHRLRAQAPGRRRELHRRAAAWFAARGELLEAARHLRAAEDWTALARFVLRAAGAEMLGTERAALVALLADVPVDLVTRHAEVAAATTVASYAEYDAGGLASRIARARTLLPGLPARDAQLTEAVLTTLEALLAWMRADAAAQVRSSEQALRRLEDVLPEEMPAVPVYRIAATTVQAMGRLWSGELGEAETALRRTVTAVSARQAMTPVLALHLHGNLAVLEAMGGRLHEARRDVDIALAVAEESGWTFLPQAATAYVAESLIRLLEVDTEACAAALARGRACVGDLRDRYAETGLSLVGARLEVSRGDLRAARAALAQLRRRTAGWAMPRFLEQWCTLVEAEVLLAEGHPEEVARLLAAARTAATGGERPHAHRLVLLARSRLLAGRPQECLQVLRPLLEEPPEDRGPATDLWVLAALAHDRLREDAPAQAALDRALAVAAPEAIARPFLVAGDGTLRLLQRYGRAHPDHDGFAAHLVERLGGAARPAAPPAPAEPLTNRERSVLQLLPTMMSNSEIAGELYLSVNTVKVHLKSLYRKLGVGTRRQAVLRAAELGLLGGSPPAPRSPARGDPAAPGPA